MVAYLIKRSIRLILQVLMLLGGSLSFTSLFKIGMNAPNSSAADLCFGGAIFLAILTCWLMAYMPVIWVIKKPEAVK